MKKFPQRILSILLVLSVLTLPSMSVFAKEGIAMNISGPGLQREITLGNSDQLWRLEDTGFFGFSDDLKVIKPPENPGEGYNITAFLIENGELIPFVEMVYYLPEKGPGFVNYLRKIDEGSLKSTDEWVELTRSADQAFRRLMTTNKIALQISIFPGSPEVVEPEMQSAVPSSASSPQS